MICMNEIGVFVINMENISKHSENKPWDGKDFLKRIEANFFWDSDE